MKHSHSLSLSLSLSLSPPSLPPSFRCHCIITVRIVFQAGSCCVGCLSSPSTTSTPSASATSCKTTRPATRTRCCSPSSSGWATSTPSSTQSSTPSSTPSSGKPSRRFSRNLASATAEDEPRRPGSRFVVKILRSRARWLCRTSALKLQALVYDILPSSTAVFSCALGSRELSANVQFFFFVGAQTVVSLLRTTQIKKKKVYHL